MEGDGIRKMGQDQGKVQDKVNVKKKISRREAWSGIYTF